MPELPEVQTTVDGIQKYTKGLIIRDVWTDYRSDFHTGKGNISDPNYFKKFRREVIGIKILGAERFGKNVLINLASGKTILIHMKMTGHVLYGRYEKEGKTWVAKDAGPLRDDTFNRFIHLIFILSNGKHLALSDMRKFARVSLENTKGIKKSKHLEGHGPDALDPKFTYERFMLQISTKPTWPVKTILMEPSIIAGIGNIYSDEILWCAGIHPLERVKKITPKKMKTMFEAMKKTLRLGMDFGGDSMSDYRNVLGEPGKFQLRHEAYQRTGEKCRKPGCGGTIIRIKIGSRSAHFCDKHQKLL